MNYDKICIHCLKPFTSTKPDKQFCKQACYFASKKQDVTRPCAVCSKDFTTAYRFRGNKTCSEECRRIGQSRTTNTRVALTCEVCGKQYERPELQAIGSKHCSDACYKSTCMVNQPPVTSKCAECGKDFTVPFIRRFQRFCSKGCSRRGPNNPMFGKPGSLAGKPSWNHGKTAETDERIAALGQKISESAKVAFAAGERSNVGEKNPNFGRTRDTRTPEQLENYSKAAVDRIQRGVSGIGKNRLSGVYKGEKSIGAAHFKSSWELTAMMAWDRDPTIVSYAYEPAWFKIEEGRRTLPDFLVTYADGTTCFFEIKPSHIQSMPHVKQKLDLTRVAVEITGVPYRMIGDEEIIMMQQQLGDALVAEISKHKRGCSTLPDPPAA